MTVRDAPRPPAQRKADALVQLQTPGIDVWVATAGTSDDDAPVAHLVPLSLAWIDEHVVIALDSQSTTARNLATARSARLALGATRDVVLIDAVVAEVVGVSEAVELADQYRGAGRLGSPVGWRELRVHPAASRTAASVAGGQRTGRPHVDAARCMDRVTTGVLSGGRRSSGGRPCGWRPEGTSRRRARVRRARAR